MGQAAVAVDYFAPNFLDEALVVLDRYGGSARVLAGGTLLGPSLRGSGDALGARALVNVKRISSLHAVERVGDALRIGALVTADALARHPLATRHAPLLSAAAGTVGARQLRSVATIGGNVLSGHHTADLALAALASNAVVHSKSARDGAREWSIDAFLDDPAVSVPDGALLVALDVPLQDDAEVAFEKAQTRRAFEMGVVSAAAVLRVDGDTVASARIAIGGCADRPILASAAEACIVGQSLSGAIIETASGAAAETDARPQDDDRASAAYRRHLARVLVSRALHRIAAGRKARR